MVIKKDCVVTVDYKLRDMDGKVLDSSEGSEPLVYLHGNDNIIVGLEKHLTGRAVGDVVDCLVPATEAYGERDESLVSKVPLSEFDQDAEVEIGQQFESQGEDGTRIVTVIDVEGDEITIDANHPLAGDDLHFTVTVVDVRAATAEELEHGHVHGGGCECGCECDGEEECGSAEDGAGGCGCGAGGCGH